METYERSVTCTNVSLNEAKMRATPNTTSPRKSQSWVEIVVHRACLPSRNLGASSSATTLAGFLLGAILNMPVFLTNEGGIEPVESDHVVELEVDQCDTINP